MKKLMLAFVLLSCSQKESKLESLKKERDSLETVSKQVMYKHLQVTDSLSRIPVPETDENMEDRAEALEDSLQIIDMRLNTLKELIRREVEEK
jgi:hypothetical protein